jgi:pimeloyl-ACP methyl ester carboxylesterase
MKRTMNQSIPKYLRRGFLFLLGIIILALVMGSIYQVWATARDLKAHPAPGKMVKVDGLMYHLNCMGTGSPIVILEAGLGESSLSWVPVQAETAKTTKVCSYDRAGLGWSEGTSKQMSSEQVATTLHDLLQTADIVAPYIVVGHSRGGIFVRHFYQQFPNEVQGMVLIDSTHENAPLRSLPYVGNDYKWQKAQMILGVFLARVGILRLTGLTDAARQHPPLLPDVILAKTAVQNRTATARAFANEIFVSQREGLDPATPHPASLGNLPLIALTASESIDVDLARQEAENDHTSVDNAVALARLELSNQQALAALSSKSRHVVVEDSGHYIMWDQPLVVIDAVVELVAAVR